MKQTTTSTKVYYFWYCDPKANDLVARRSIGGAYKAVALEREDKRKAGYETGFIYHYTEMLVKFEKE